MNGGGVQTWKLPQQQQCHHLLCWCIGAPQDVYSYWYPNAFPFGDAIYIIGSVLAETATNATVLTITGFTVKRYIAISYPFRDHPSGVPSVVGPQF
ncbi:PREDICTED: neuromedin-U receptor 2-like [Bactrocera latifrons]|uniref:neuromedin-U receptor 2-like n=1 Tax=Bactrocera latifrons TaxID=174628 RepID=UPI0008DD0A0D|nr:PREDICTED: neuromedin-U receptor 2-like [Bactrocera latifrons]